MKRWVAILLASIAVVLLVLAIVCAFESGTDNSKFVVGKPLPQGTVMPQLVIDGTEQAVLLAPDGTLWSWGGSAMRPLNAFTGIASGPPGSSRTAGSPARIGEEKNWRRVTKSSAGVAAIKSDGSLWIWTGGARSGPASMTRIGTDSDWVEVSGLTSHFMALKADGSLWGWGQNESGQIGNGETNSPGRQTQAPVMVGTDHDWKAISAGSFNSYALKRDGTVWGWGSRMNQAVSGKTNNVYSPEQIDPGTNWVAISAGDFHLLALKSDGTIWIRGQNGHVAAPATFSAIPFASRDQSVLTQIGKDSDWDRINSGQNCFFARKKDGSWWSCGSDQSGQLGRGSATNSTGSRGAMNSVPLHRLQIDFEPWAFASGGPTTLLLTRDGSLWSWGTRLGVSKSGLGNKGLKGMYDSAVAWWKKRFQKQPPAQSQRQVGRGGLPLGFGGSTANDAVTDYSPYRIWSIPPDMRNALEKEAAKSADGRNGNAH